MLSVEARGDHQLYGINLQLVEDSATRLEFTLDWNYSEEKPYVDFMVSPTFYLDVEDHPSTDDRAIVVQVYANGLQGLPLQEASQLTFSFWLPTEAHPFLFDFSDTPISNPPVFLTGGFDQLLFTHTIQPIPIYSRITLDADAEFGRFVFSTEPVPDAGATLILFGAGMALLVAKTRRNRE